MEETTAEAAEPTVEGGAPAADATTNGSKGRRSGSISKLEEEGDIAADYLEELLDIADLDGDIDIDIENGRASVAVVAEGNSHRRLQRLVGEGGDVLEALQELTRLAVQAQTGDRTRLLLDVAGYRAERRASLTALATEACERVKASGTDTRLEPMPAFERKVVHDAVAAAGLESESEGEEPKRYVVILAPTSGD
ncbi:spoIIIJ-associated protein [Kineococcus xinjiangensis]|uniref:SpoIIIJ-associated protein n=1 Tax=Kineococcus xinjiangensis TaxID=512762 RepID=A0A2S6II06_9ACTN|nr:R3H domain-containing nucleic acid-binding protein [Kineococcus xinjiangensis]PPK93847.1 spoIIIJ-associated protein [Kineococcus xinjiangensis]